LYALLQKHMFYDWTRTNSYRDLDYLLRVVDSQDLSMRKYHSSTTHVGDLSPLSTVKVSRGHAT